MEIQYITLYVVRDVWEEATRISRGYQARPEIHVKSDIFSQTTLYVRNVNRVSNDKPNTVKPHLVGWHPGDVINVKSPLKKKKKKNTNPFFYQL